MARVRIHEGASGIVRLGSSDGELFVPDYDLDAACELLFQVYELRDDQGMPLRKAYLAHGHNWLCGQLNFLFARCIYRFVQYRRLAQELEERGQTPLFADKAGFHKLWELLHPPRQSFRPGDAWAYRRVLPAHNVRLAQNLSPEILFYRYGPGDFRTKEMLAHFEEREVDFAFVYSPSRKLIRARNDMSKTGGRPAYLLYAKHSRANAFRRRYDLSGFDPLTRRFLTRAITLAEERMTADMADYLRHKANLQRMRPKLFFALEDLNRLHPLLFACRDLGIPSIGYQTGTYSSRQSANVLHHWGPGEYEYFDQLIVWGSYWEEVCRANSEAFPRDFFIIGANKHTYAYRRLDSDQFDPMNVLVPFEYLANTYAIGRYMERMVELGYRVHFKLKPDWDPERQLSCYHLSPETRDKLVLVREISDEVMATINVVAGSMTTLLFDLLPYGKHTWVLETEYRLLDDMVRSGLARKVSLNDLPGLTPPPRADEHADYASIFNPGSVRQVLDQHVLSRL